jgi:chromate transporter
LIYLQLFLTFFHVGSLSFGGGYASLPLIQEQVVLKHKWLSMAEFVDIITISQMTPGPIALNTSTFVGTRMAGFPGAVVATLGCVTPSCIIVLILAFLYKRYKNLSVVQAILSGLRPAVVALIASAGTSIVALTLWHDPELGMSAANFNGIGVVLFVTSLAIMRIRRVGPIKMMLANGVVGAVLYYFLG